MKHELVFIFFINLLVKCNTQNPTILEAVLLEPFRVFRSAITKSIANNPPNTRFQRKISTSESFPCQIGDSRSAKVPTSVHKLKPGDIDIIGALGDSLTTGYGVAATNFLDMAAENRGMVYSIGGQGTWKKFLTLPNILKLYNPELFGYSLGPSITIDRNSQFNTAENGAISDNIPYMTQVLITRIKRDARTDLKKHWKMISIMIGANDFCSEICYYKNPEESVERHKKDLLKALRLIRDQLPRTFVNVILPPDVSQLANFTNLPNECQITQRLSCPCFIGSRFSTRLKEFQEVIRKFQMIGIDIATYPEFDREDFTVVAQPLLFHSTLPIGVDGYTDKSYFSIDCFHFSQKAHAEIARALWNNIFEPVGQKGTSIFVEDLMCPTIEKPYLATNRNSR